MLANYIIVLFTAIAIYRGDLNSVKQDKCVFKDSFKSSNPECNSVDTNWNSFKEALANSISRHIPKKKIKAHKDLPWITHDIKKAMKHQRQLYDYAKLKKAGVLIVRLVIK